MIDHQKSLIYTCSQLQITAEILVFTWLALTKKKSLSNLNSPPTKAATQIPFIQVKQTLLIRQPELLTLKIIISNRIIPLVMIQKGCKS
jgi:hypothetical protein